MEGKFPLNGILICSSDLLLAFLGVVDMCGYGEGAQCDFLISFFISSLLSENLSAGSKHGVYL